MRKTLLLSLSLGLVCVAGCGSKEFKEFTSAEGRFKVLMPGAPKEQVQNVAGNSMKAYSVEQRNGAYMVAFMDAPIPPNEADAQIQARLDGARDGAAGNVKGKVVGETRITLDNKYPGRDVRIELPDKKGLIRNKIYLVNGRLYQVMVLGTEAWSTSSDAEKFLDSFALTP